MIQRKVTLLPCNAPLKLINGVLKSLLIPERGHGEGLF
jgi:hypothetical protein